MSGRDLTAAQFKAALARNGFEHAFMGAWYRDMTGATPNSSFGAIFDRKTLKLCRRATIAHLIRERKRAATKSVSCP